MDNMEYRCSCHINPPCGYCTEKEPCLQCGEPVHPSEAQYIEDWHDRTVSVPMEPPHDVGPFCCEECKIKFEEGAFE